MVSNWEIARTIFSGLTLISITLAYLGYRGNRKKQEQDKKVERDKEIVSQAVLSLQWAYEALSGGREGQPPSADRLNWLTVARHIRRYYRLREQVDTETYRLVLAGKEEYWRHRFYVALDYPELRSSNYYMSTEDQRWPENIELTSAMVLVDFSNWPKSSDDPLDEVDRAKLIENGNPFGGLSGRGLELYASALEEAKEHITNAQERT